MTSRRPKYKGRTWVTNTWSKEYHGAQEAQCYSRGGCTCIRCLVECTIMQDAISGPAIFNTWDEKDISLVGLYLKEKC